MFYLVYTTKYEGILYTETLVMADLKRSAIVSVTCPHNIC
jgi:hypothetical protein